MTTQEQVDSVRETTRQRDETKIVRALNQGKDWAWTKVYNSTNGPDVLMSFDTEKTMSSVTREYDLGANVSGTLYAIKQLWLRLSGDTNFTLMLPRDAAADPQFALSDQYPSSDTTSVATGHPVRYDIFNFAKVRFAPMLPSGAIIRIDAVIKPPDIDPTTNTTQTYGNDMPEPIHEPMVKKAISLIFNQLNDDRWKDWAVMAERELNDALYLLTRRNQGPTITTPFRIRRRRWI